MSEGFIIRRGGGGKNKSLVVKAYASEEVLPSSAKEGEIAVISSTPVQNVYFQTAEPSEVNNGDLWITFDSRGKNSTNTDNIIFYPQKAFQYINSQWVEVSILIWNGENWTVPSKEFYILSEAKINPEAGSYINVSSAPLTGGKIISTAPDAIKANNGYFSNKMKLDDYNTIKMHINLQQVYAENYTFTFGASSSVITSGDYASNSNKFTAKTTLQNLGEYWAYVDISNLTGSYYIGFTSVAKFEIDEIILTEEFS